MNFTASPTVSTLSAASSSIAIPNSSSKEATNSIDWMAITREGDPSTNYQLLPGDRLFIAHDRLTALNALIVKVTLPIERIFGFTLLGSQTIQNLQRFPEGQLFRSF